MHEKINFMAFGVPMGDPGTNIDMVHRLLKAECESRPLPDPEGWDTFDNPVHKLAQLKRIVAGMN